MADETFGEFAATWLRGHEHQLARKTRLDYSWQLSSHLLPFFAYHPLSAITIAEVDRYRQAKVQEGTLSVTSINKTITRLAQILEVAFEYGLIERNPAKGRRRRLRPARRAPVWLDRASWIEALLTAATHLDEDAASKGGRSQRGGLLYRRALIATLMFAGLRMSELTGLRWRDVDLHGGRLIVGESKTDAGLREIDLLPVLLAELASHRDRARSLEADAFVFSTASGTRPDQGNIRRRVFYRAVARADALLSSEGEAPLPEGLTPHKLRHTYASILIATGADPGVAMEQLGHADPGFTLRVYRHAMRRGEAEREALAKLVLGGGGAPGELRENWARARRHEPLLAIDPLR